MGLKEIASSLRGAAGYLWGAAGYLCMIGFFGYSILFMAAIILFVLWCLVAGLAWVALKVYDGCRALPQGKSKKVNTTETYDLETLRTRTSTDGNTSGSDTEWTE
ncbi:hypothetical protein MYU51_007869 [Penicillium brevicompactum]|uniref:uncharacterized protein n=1 Tax=Penicillium brevicompactum TaxID=5074 RepID=UPI0025406191|nr:uncharacterized protein N7506_001273 [Penicillium brevicompactum]KAJ5348020.1 hypothetical protein N7506_001273 [Penicillium brevicompactum]